MSYQWKQRMFAGLIWTALIFGAGGCSFKETYVRVYDELFPPQTTTAVAPAPQVSLDETAANMVLKCSPRLNKLVIPAGMAPTIRVTGWNKTGFLTFESALCGGGKVPATGNYEYIIVTVKDGQGGDSAASHGTRDSRWNKFFGNDLQKFAVFLVTNRNKVIEWSKVTFVTPAAK